MRDVYVYGKAKCSKCDAAKAHLTTMGVAYQWVDMDEASANPPADWRATPIAAARAEYEHSGTLPVIVLNGAAMSYPAAMRRLKGKR